MYNYYEAQPYQGYPQYDQTNQMFTSPQTNFYNNRYSSSSSTATSSTGSSDSYSSYLNNFRQSNFIPQNYIRYNCSPCQIYVRQNSSLPTSTPINGSKPINEFKGQVKGELSPIVYTKGQNCEEPCCTESALPPYVSQVEESIKNSNKPITSNAIDIIEINGIRGIWLNKDEVESWKGEIPLSKYEINSDPNPEVVKLKQCPCVDRVQECSIKFLKPPRPNTPGPIIIKQEANYATPAAPPIIIRKLAKETSCLPSIIIREKPPTPPEPICTKTIVIPGKRLPPPPRNVIIEKLAPEPPVPQTVTVERWLPYEKRERKVILEKKPLDPCVVKPKNIIYEWQPQCVNTKTNVKDLGVEESCPNKYALKHGASLKSVNELPEFAKNIKAPVSSAKDMELVGDLEALKLIDLDKEGLSHYKKYVKKI